jgi:phage gpG-like protein
MQVNIKVTGLQEVQSGLQRLDTGLQDCSELVYKAGLLIEEQAKQNASGRPGPNVITGNLRASIVTKLSSPVTAMVGTNISYASAVEFGHNIKVGIGSRGGLIRNTRHLNPSSIGSRMTRAYPYFFESVGQTADKIKLLAQAWINKLIGK